MFQVLYYHSRVMDGWMGRPAYSTTTTSKDLTTTADPALRRRWSATSETLRSSSALGNYSYSPSGSVIPRPSSADYTSRYSDYPYSSNGYLRNKPQFTSGDFDSTTRRPASALDYRSRSDYKPRSNSACSFSQDESSSCPTWKRRPHSAADFGESNFRKIVQEYNNTIGLLASGSSGSSYLNGDCSEGAQGSTMPRLPTMQGSDRAYYRRVKEILEAPPNKGPPYTPSRIGPHVYLGNIRNAEDYSLLQRNGITHVLNLAGTRHFERTRSPYPPEVGVKNYMLIPAEDHTEYNMAQHFQECIKFLDECKQNGGIALVHCNLGINRSGAIAAIYLMADTKKTLLDVISFLKLKRSVVLCNRAFRRQVIQYARDHNLLDPPEKPELRRRNSEQTESVSVEVKKKGVGRLFSRTNSSKSLATEEELRKGHRRTKSDPLDNMMVNPRGGLSAKQVKALERQNGVVTPSMQRPLRLSSSTSSVRAPTPEDDEDEADYKFDTSALDTLYEEIEQMNMTAPHAAAARYASRQRAANGTAPPSQPTTSTIAIHVPEDPRVPAGRPGAANAARPYQNSAYLTVPSQRVRRVGVVQPPSRPQSVHEGSTSTAPGYRLHQSRANVTFASAQIPTEDSQSASKSFFGTLFRRKTSSNSSSSKPWRRSVHF